MAVFGLRIFFAFQTPFFSSDQAYFHKQVSERILSGESPWYDTLGYGGRSVIISPLFESLLSFAGLFFDENVVLKVLPNFFASLLVIPAFFIAFRLTGNDWISASTSLLASIVPVFVAKTFNHISPLSLAVPVFFFLIYAWLSEKIKLFVFMLVFFAFLNPLSVVLVLSIGVYFVLSALDRLDVKVIEYERGVFSIFFTLWVHFLVFKKLILFHGASVIWRNIPVPLLSSFFARITLLQAMVQIGIYPVAQGIYALYVTILRNPLRDVNMLFAVCLTSGILLWVKVIDLSSGMMLLGVTLAVLFSRWSLLVFQYVKRTRIAKFAGLVTFLSIALAVFTTAYPAYAAVNSELLSTVSSDDISALEWARDELPSDSVVVSPVNYGHYVSAVAGKKTVIDSYFFLQPRINERFDDVLRVYSTPFETEAVELFDKYNATHLIIPPGVKDVKYSDSHCFSRVYEKRVRIYEKDPECKVRVVK